MSHLSSVSEFVPTDADLAAWREQSLFFMADVVRITSLAESTIQRWFASGVFRHGEAYRVSGTAGFGGRFRFTRAGLKRVFREHRMAQALLHIGEAPSCYAVYVGPDPVSCRLALSASEHDIAIATDPFACGEILGRNRSAIVIVDFTGTDQTCDDYNALIGMCRSIRAATVFDPDMRPAVLGFGIPAADASVVDRAIGTIDDLCRVAVELCGARQST